jgi:hypothetical protein
MKKSYREYPEHTYGELPYGQIARAKHIYINNS